MKSAYLLAVLIFGIVKASEIDKEVRILFLFSFGFSDSDASLIAITLCFLVIDFRG